MRFSLSERRLLHYTPEYLAKSGVTTTGAKPLSSTPQANVDYQNAVHQAAVTSNQQNQGIYVGNLEKTQYSSAESKPVRLADGSSIYVPKDSNPVIPESQQWKETTPQAPAASTPSAPAPASTPSPSSALTKLTGQDLINAANKRREERLAQQGLDQNSELRKLLDSGAVYTGNSQNGSAIFKLKDGTMYVSPFADSSVQKEVEMYNKTTVDSAMAEIQQENKDAVSSTFRDPSKESQQGMQDTPQTGTTQDQSKLPSELQAAVDPVVAAENRIASLAQQELELTRAGLTEQAAQAREDKRQAEEDAMTIYKDKLEFNSKIDQLQRDRNDEIERQLLAQNARKEELQKVEGNRAEQVQRQKNIQTELQNRRLAAKLGINHDTGGLDWMNREVQTGLDALTYIIQKNANALGEIADTNMKIINAYALDMRQADLEATSRYSEAYSSYQSEKTAIQKDYLAGEKDRSSMLKEAQQRYYDTLQDVDRNKAKAYSDANYKVFEAAQESAKKEREGMMSTKDKLGFTASLRSGINQNKIITQANDVDGFYGALLSGYDEYVSLIEQIESGAVKASDVSLNPSQSAVIGSLARILDPGSVVRNEEYERQVLGQSAPNIIRGWWEKLKAGGTGLTKQDVVAMKNLADGLHESWETKLSEAMQPFILDIQDWNANYPEAQIRYEQVIPVDRVHLPSQTINTWTEQAGSYNTSGIENPTGGGWKSPDDPNTPSGGWRTDRNNNPTAFTVDVARQGGLVEGKDFYVDPKLQNGFPTATIIGDPIEKTIKVIDNIGFYTNSGSPRWTHTAISKSEWDSKNLDQKKEFIAMMYQREGGTGILAQGIQPKRDIASAQEFSLIPTAEAASPDDTIYFEEVPEIASPRSGSIISMGTVNNAGTQLKILGTFRNKNTGEILRPTTPSQVEYYKSKPYGFEDLEAPRQAAAAPLVLAGKTLPM